MDKLLELMNDYGVEINLKPDGEGLIIEIIDPMLCKEATIYFNDYELEGFSELSELLDDVLPKVNF